MDISSSFVINVAMDGYNDTYVTS